MAINPDVLYQKQRESLLQYEDARFSSLLSGVPNCYTANNDSTLWGSILRAVAQELARLEYFYSYDLVSLDPQYLTPPDIKRQWAAPLGINKSYPDPSQTDLDYKYMLVGLLAAYPEGTTVQAISDVIRAYTGQTIEVEELYKEIGNGIYDESDRNAIKLTLNSNSADPFSQLTSSSRLATLSQNLYAAIDLAKPAHIGLNYTISFGSGEDLNVRIKAITDALNIVYNGEEPSPLPPVFTLAPMEDPDSPDTRLTGGENSTAEGVLAPQLSRAWEIKADEFKIYRLD